MITREEALEQLDKLARAVLERHGPRAVRFIPQQSEDGNIILLPQRVDNDYTLSADLVRKETLPTIEPNLLGVLPRLSFTVSIKENPFLAEVEWMEHKHAHLVAAQVNAKDIDTHAWHAMSLAEEGGALEPLPDMPCSTLTFIPSTDLPTTFHLQPVVVPTPEAFRFLVGSPTIRLVPK